jgi:hypothetical protein
MRADEVRVKIQADHQEIRGALLSIESLSRDALAGRWKRAGPLRLEAEHLLNRLLDHMYWEDLHLAPALRAAGDWGNARAERLDEEHREQRELLRHSLERVGDRTRPTPLLAQNLVDLISLLRADMAEEDELLLDTRLCRESARGVDLDLS